MLNWLLRSKRLPSLLPGDYRTAPRHMLYPEGKEQVEACVGPSRWPAIVHDISTTGIGLILGQRFEEGTPLAMCLFNRQRNYACPLRAQVVYTTRLPDGHWFAGCYFDEGLRGEELEKLL